MSLRIAALVLGLLLQACSGTPVTPPPESESPVAEVLIEDWLQAIESVQGLDPEKARRQLERMNTNIQGTALFEFGLLSMRIGTYSSLTEAQESFQWLAEDESLGPGLNQLAQLFSAHCRELLGWHQKYDQTRLDLRRSQAANELLQQKLDALTELEVLFSDRKIEDHSYRTVE